MFLPRKWIVILISVTGVFFLTLLIIQFIWIGKSVEINRQKLESRIRTVAATIRKAFSADRDFQEKYLSANGPVTDFSIRPGEPGAMQVAIESKVNSALKAENIPVSSDIHGRIGNHCYLMNDYAGERRNTGIDNSQFRICLCDRAHATAFDLGINIGKLSQLNGVDPAGLIFPSLILILLLIGLFVYTISIINKQKKMAESKNDFINHLTHEFNTPLFAIGITSGLLQKSPAVQGSEKLNTYVNLIVTEKNRIQAQVDKMLRLTAIESGGVIMEQQIIDIHQMIKEVIERFRLIVEQKLGTIKLNANAMSTSVKGDPAHLFNAFSNVIDNACKYSDKPPEIDIATHNSDDHLVITITDKGIGIPPEEVKTIFDKFYRVRHGEQQQINGFGLGLNYVSKVLELHKGFIEVRSEAGKGSIFTIHLPLYTKT